MKGVEKFMDNVICKKSVGLGVFAVFQIYVAAAISSIIKDAWHSNNA